MKVLLAYSGGLDTSVAIHWLLATRKCEVVAFAANLGQCEDLRRTAKRALATGASDVRVEDLRERFVNEYVFPAIQANAVYENGYLLNTALGRPLIAQELVRAAQHFHCDTVGHGCTAKGNDQVRIEAGITSLAPELKIIAPVREWEFKSREEEIDYARKHGIAVPVTRESPYSIDQNLWGASIECGELEDPWQPPPRDTYILTRPAEEAPNRAAEISLNFDAGIPVALNGRSVSGVKLIETLNAIGGEHAIGRTDMIENRVVGIKSREVYEAPAAAILIAAHQALEDITLSRDVARQKTLISHVFSDIVYTGRWFSDLREAVMAFITATQRYVTGTVRVSLYKGRCTVTGRSAPYSLYDKTLATYGAGDAFVHEAAKGFLAIYNLDLKAQGLRRKRYQAKRPRGRKA